MAYAHKMHLHLKEGALHHALHVGEGKKIPHGALEKAAHSGSPLMRKRAQFAINASHWHHHSHAEHHDPGHDHEITRHIPQIAESGHMAHPFGHEKDHSVEHVKEGR